MIGELAVVWPSPLWTFLKQQWWEWKGTDSIERNIFILSRKRNGSVKQWEWVLLEPVKLNRAIHAKAGG